MLPPKNKKKPFPGEDDASASDDAEEQKLAAEAAEEDDDASSSQARPKQMKGEKPHPLRRWAAAAAVAGARALFGRK